MNAMTWCALLALLAGLGGCASSGGPDAVPAAPAPGARAEGPPALGPVATNGAQNEPAPAAPPAPAPIAIERALHERVPGAPPSNLKEVFPHVRVDVARKRVEFDGVVPIDCHDPVTPVVYLEVFVCTPDTREHEALVMTKAKASEVHAALLMIGLEAGGPGRIAWDGPRPREIAPTGAKVKVRFRVKGAEGAGREEVESDPWSWVVLTSGAKPDAGAGSFVFAGSRFFKRADPASGVVREFYDADGAGTLIGLTTFGSETIAWSRVLSPDAAVHEPEWLADAKVVPKAGSAVVVVVEAE